MLLLADIATLSLLDATETARSLAAFHLGLGQDAVDEQDLRQILLLLTNLGRQLCPQGGLEGTEDHGALVPSVVRSGKNPRQKVALYLESGAVTKGWHGSSNRPILGDRPKG